MVSAARPVTIGADVLEIMSIAMYAEPLVIYRELVQNSADAIDEAIRDGFLEPCGGEVRLSFERQSRSVSILDNGSGLSNERFADDMLAFGASAKRNDNYRGFRGIGRLAGLGHCRELVFRSRSRGDRHVFEARWDGAKVRKLVLSEEVVPLERLAQEAVQITHAVATDEPAHFFEVRLEGLRRLSDDRLFDPTQIARFLSQVAPVPFTAQFSYGMVIRAELLRRSRLLELSLVVGGSRIFKPYNDEIDVRSNRVATIREIEFVELPSTDECTAAVGWIAHHEYLGALKGDYPGRGLRVRSGNLQIGDETILSKAFPESRFNAWSIGEFHVFDSRLRPNARRDAFEPSVHVDNLFNQLLPYGTAIARRCRVESKQRNGVKRIAGVTTTLDRLDETLSKNRTALGDAVRSLIADELSGSIDALRSEPGVNSETLQTLAALERRVTKLARPRARGELSTRDRGRLDVMRWLQEAGHDDLLAAAVAKLTSK